MAETKKKTASRPAEGVQAGMLSLYNITVQDSGRSLSSVYSRERRDLLVPFAKMVREGMIMAGPLSTMKMKGYMHDLQLKGGLDKLSDTALSQLYNSFQGTLSNVLAVAKADRRYEEAWKRLITSLEVTTIQLKEQLGREVIVAAGYSWHYCNFAEILFAPLTVIDLWQTYSRADKDYHRHGLLSMNVETRTSLSDLFFGIDYRLPHLSAELPADRGLTIENFEQATATDLMMLDGVALNGSLLGSNGAITSAAVKKVKTQTPITDFTHTPGQWPTDRVEMLALTYFTLLDAKDKNGKKEIDIRQLARFAVEYMTRYLIGPMYNTFLPHLQGFTKSWTIHSYPSRVAHIVQSILMEAKDEWLDLSNFRMMLLCSPTEGDDNYIFLTLFTNEGQRKAKLIRKADKEKGIDTNDTIDWGEEVGLKFAVHWVKYLCALGLVELAVDPQADEQRDLMEGMRYARLTPLGRYALGIDAEYTLKSAEGNLGIEFDPRNAIITIDAKSPYQMFLSNVAKRISPTRFSISAETLLKGCATKGELEQRIDNLRTIIDPEKEPALKNIIDEARLHTDCAVRDGGYSLLRLRADLPGLRDAILTNRELREMTILAGPTLALVKTHKIDRFNSILAGLGYLMA
ncbi:MAG: hypothetical protein K2I92_04600 [Muribaculaceae bacterium]|nr:hypothetical protein [Muribaculaceae bacterium]